jgi:DNA-binding MarR family transcriptional regulator
MRSMLEDVPSADRRQRRLQLSPRGMAIVKATRAARLRLDARLRRRFGHARIDAARRLLLEVIEVLGGLDAIRERRVRPPR